MNPPETDLDLTTDLPAERGTVPSSGSVPTQVDRHAETRAADSAPRLTERTLGDFHLLRKLGSGGMADVYLAEQVSLKRKVAIKVLRPELVRESDDVVLKRFEREARAAAGLTHRNIVQVYTIGEQDGFHYIAQEYVEGLNLREFLKRKGPPDATIALHIMRQVAAALAKAGEAGIVHRDIKPENILITRKGEVKVGDFGLAQLTHSGERLHLTQQNITMGTPLYMSPEQVHGKPLDQRSDIYSFGVTCYHLLAGQPPFRGDNALSVAVQHVNQEPRPLAELRSDLPAAILAVVHKMMAKQPDDRYPGAASLLQDLRTIARALKQDPQDAAETLARFNGLVPASALPPRNIWERVSRWSVRLRVAVLVGLALVVGGSAAAIGWWMRPTNPLALPPRELQSQIPDTKSLERQYLFALFTDGEQAEEAWQAVIDYFPNDEDSLYVWRAREQLGILYLVDLRLDDAQRIFEEFTLAGEFKSRQDLRARGEAGKAIIANLEGDYARSQGIIDRHFALKDGSEALVNHLDPSGALRELLQQAELINRRQLRLAQPSSPSAG